MMLRLMFNSMLRNKKKTFPKFLQPVFENKQEYVGGGLTIHYGKPRKCKPDMLDCCEIFV